MKSRTFRSPIFWLLLVFAAIVAFAYWPTGGGDDVEEISLNEFDRELAAGELESVEMVEGANVIKAVRLDGTEFEVRYIGRDSDQLANEILAVEPEVELTVGRDTGGNFWVSLLFTLLPPILFVGLFLFIFLRLNGNRTNGFGKTNAKKMEKDMPTVTFSDVAGADEAVEELREIKEFLSDPVRFYSMGAKIPKGVLLYGPPGTGKTLLARAVAGEAGVPFFSISGSDFVEMFVGVGASRVRDLFQQAKEEAPAIIFVDEIDAVGRHRGAGLGGGHDEREQTLNQMLVEMDGFDPTSGVIMIAATNRPDILDPALLRPGRFDRQITVDRPDLEGRLAILDVHVSGKPLAEEVELDTIARRTPGFTGADLANLMNEAALLAARHRRTEIDMELIDEAIDRVMAGPQRKSRVLSDHERRVIAYHEAGHALVGHVLHHTYPIHKVSIIARGRALGWTLALPEVDRYLRTRSQLHDDLAMLLGGRTAEEMIFGDPTTGAADDIDRVTNVARAMVTEYGMSDEVGPRKLGNTKGEVFLGKDIAHEADYSQSMAMTIDAEVQRFVNLAHEEARAILTSHIETLDALAEALLEHETLDKEQLQVIFGNIEWHRDSSAFTRRGETIDLRSTDVGPLATAGGTRAGEQPAGSEVRPVRPPQNRLPGDWGDPRSG
ncbi:MAG: ATP-dependent zinc metalloprotease FtsH [Acidimicrobiales bacterium]